MRITNFGTNLRIYEYFGGVLLERVFLLGFGWELGSDRFLGPHPRLSTTPSPSEGEGFGWVLLDFCDFSHKNKKVRQVGLALAGQNEEESY